MEVSTMAGKHQELVTKASWRPGLPPPIEDLREEFRPDDGWAIDYAEMRPAR
jgi:hypothetical protein